MLKKILSNRIVLMVCTVCIILVVGIVLCFALSQDSKVDQTDKPQVEQEDNEAKEKDHEVEKSEGAGLEIKEEVDEDVDSIEGSGSWDTTTDSSGSKEHNNKTDETIDDDILEDDKEWGTIS